MQGVDKGNNICNKIAEWLVNRIEIAIKKRQKFRVIIVLPVHPDGPTEDGTTKAISHWIYTTVSREKNGHSILQVRVETTTTNIVVSLSFFLSLFL